MVVILAVVVAAVFVRALLRNPGQGPGRGAPAGQATPVAQVAPASPSPPARAIRPAIIKGTSVSSVDEQGQRQWELYAESVIVDSAAGTATLTVVRGTHFKDGRPATTFVAPRGVFSIVSRNVTLTGRVQARSAAGHALEADRVQWLAKKQQLEASGAVVLHQRGMTVYADRLTADVELQRTRLAGRIRVTVAP
jgi:LPS export ABC transporter protein LptC